jgi:hypothetical protein
MHVSGAADILTDFVPAFIAAGFHGGFVGKKFDSEQSLFAFFHFASDCLDSILRVTLQSSNLQQFKYASFKQVFLASPIQELLGNKTGLPQMHSNPTP